MCYKDTSRLVRYVHRCGRCTGKVMRYKWCVHIWAQWWGKIVSRRMPIRSQHWYDPFKSNHRFSQDLLISSTPTTLLNNSPTFRCISMYFDTFDGSRCLTTPLKYFQHFPKLSQWPFKGFQPTLGYSTFLTLFDVFRCLRHIAKILDGSQGFSMIFVIFRWFFDDFLMTFCKMS